MGRSHETWGSNSMCFQSRGTLEETLCSGAGQVPMSHLTRSHSQRKRSPRMGQRDSLCSSAPSQHPEEPTCCVPGAWARTGRSPRSEPRIHRPALCGQRRLKNFNLKKNVWGEYETPREASKGSLRDPGSHGENPQRGTQQLHSTVSPLQSL